MEELNWKYGYTDVDKDQNQYTYEECNRIGPVDAKYVKSSNKDFNGNPFIEALPRPRDGKELIKAYTCSIPAVDMGELDDMTINEQKETVLSLKRLRLPLSFHKQLEFINYDVVSSSCVLVISSKSRYVCESTEIFKGTIDNPFFFADSIEYIVDESEII